MIVKVGVVHLHYCGLKLGWLEKQGLLYVYMYWLTCINAHIATDKAVGNGKVACLVPWLISLNVLLKF